MMKSAGRSLLPSPSLLPSIDHLTLKSLFLSPFACRIVRKNRSRPFKDFHSEWLETLRSLLRLSMSSSSSSSSSLPAAPHRRHLGASTLSSPSDLLSTRVHALHSHFQSYYRALDLAARHDVSQLLSPDFRNPLEKPFLWIADFHPSLFTNLLRSFLDPSFHSPYHPDRPFPPFSTAFDSPSQDLISNIDQIERGLRLIVPAINKRLRELQCCFVENIAAEWAATSSKGKEDGSVTVSEEAIRSQLEELESVFGDANRLRRSILSEIVGAADVYQGALFLEAVAEFVLGFRDPDLLREFEQCKIPLSPESS